MNNNQTDILIAAAGNKRKNASLRLMAVGLVSALALILLLVVIDRGNTGGALIEVVSSPVVPKVGQLSSLDNSRLTESIKLYNSGLKVNLELLKGRAGFGERATELIEELDIMISLRSDHLSSGKVDTIVATVLRGMALVDEYSSVVEDALRRLAESFDKKHLTNFERELSNVNALAPGDSRLQRWTDMREDIPDYFSAARQAERARAENSPKEEVRALEQVVDLGFGAPEISRRIDELNLQMASRNYEQYMSLARNYYHSQNYQKAFDLVEKSLLIYPTKEQAKELKVSLLKELARVEAERWVVRAQEQAVKDLWLEASANYKKAKDLVKNHKLASLGYTLAKTILDLQMRLQDFNDRPLRLSDDKVMSHAKELLAESAQYVSYSPSLAKLVRQVETLLESIVPRSLWVDSDGKARIRVKGVGFIEPTNGKSVNLKPGKYDFYAECAGHKTKIYVVDIPLKDVVPPMRVVCGKSI